MNEDENSNDKDFSWLKFACPSCAIYYGINFLVSSIKNRKVLCCLIHYPNATSYSVDLYSSKQVIQ